MPQQQQPSQTNMSANELGEAKVKELMLNLTKPGANVPKIAQSIITVSYNNSAGRANAEAETLETQSNGKYGDIVAQKRALEKTIAQEETVKGLIKSKEIESKENKLAAEKVEKAQQLVIENEKQSVIQNNRQEKKAISDEKAAEAKAQMAKLQLQRETAAAKAEMAIGDANILSEDMAKQVMEQEAEKKKETAEALAREQEVTGTLRVCFCVACVRNRKCGELTFVCFFFLRLLFCSIFLFYLFSCTCFPFLSI